MEVSPEALIGAGMVMDSQNIREGTVLVGVQGAEARQLVLVLKNDSTGAVGLNITGSRVRVNMTVLDGGPDEKQTMRFVHKRTGHDGPASLPLANTGYAVREMTASAEDKRLMGFLVKSVPKGSVLVLGATAWKPGVLEEEIAWGKWQESSTDLFSIFHKEPGKRVEAACRSLVQPQAI